MHLSSKNILMGEVIPTYFKVRMYYVVNIVKVHLK